MIRIRTHVINKHHVCALCGMEIPTLQNGRPFFPSEMVGVIETTVIPPSSYRVGENDSNQKCYEEDNHV